MEAERKLEHKEGGTQHPDGMVGGRPCFLGQAPVQCALVPWVGPSGQVSIPRRGLL